jgi:aspartyl-tRNA(Asn)/glutamyl-tRNA(Gln) amidotransferase subunit B
MNTEWEIIIGLEVHVQLMTQSKLFSGSKTAYGALPNTQASIIDLGFPGVLPVFNKTALDMAVKFGLSIGANISPKSVFARKNYFYPDLPKGYQISQYNLPIVVGGSLLIHPDDGAPKRITITRAHLEEDAGKSLHEHFEGHSGIDLNRAGIPLLEVVSEPEMRSAKEAVSYLKTLHALIRYLEISDGNLQEGSFRCDANVSVRRRGETKLGTRAEIKNVNSFRFVEKAIQYEAKRQIEILEQGGTIVQETRSYDAHKDETRSLRTKEEANDYRYFPDPDLLPVLVDEAFIARIQKELPELPQEKAQRFETMYALSSYDAHVLTVTKELAHYFEETLSSSGTHEPKLCANWIMGELLAALNKENLDITESPLSPSKLGQLILRIHDKTISGKIAKTIFERLLAGEKDVDAIIEKQGLQQVTDTSFIEKIIDEVLKANPTQVADYKGGKDKLFGFFIGQIMKVGQGKLNPEQVNEILQLKLKI